MGWPDETKEQDFFYPTNDLVTGPDIIFFWVARMIMAGLEFKGEIPFRNVYFTSIIRDDLGRKLSKSLGNSPDPLDVMAEYGTDALRFSIIYIAPVGLDIRYSNQKCELGRNFANKIWNASRFRRMQGPCSARFRNPEDIDPSSLGDDDRWILGRLVQVASGVVQSLDNFRFHEATHNLYEFVWSEFCDWYIEVSKHNYRDESTKESALQLFDFVWFSVLKLLHPFMPFLTEEVAHQLDYVEAGSFVVHADFPDPASLIEKLPVDEELIRRVKAKFSLVSAGRNLRASYQIPPGKPIPYFVKPVTRDMADYLASNADTLAQMLKAEKVVVDAEYLPDGPAPSLVTDAGTVYLPLKGLIDIEAEKGKLLKQRKELQGWIAGSRAKLGNERFLAQAPPQVIEEAKTKLDEMLEKLDRVEQSLHMIGE
jgi:valyl-tRNA synthetase